MFSSKTREPRIMYVAASARELPGEVQDWLGRAENRAASSPHIYDALASLAGGARPVVLIVSMEAVDWSEMEFFDQVARLCRDTHVYVTGEEHQAAKLAAACKRGARLFDEEALQDSLSGPAPWSRGPGVSDLLAGTLRPENITKVIHPTPLRPVPVEPEEPEEPEETDEPEFTEELPLPEPEAPCQPGTIREPEPAAAEPSSVRLIDQVAAGIEEEPVEEETHQPIPFPWSPGTKRPQRIPPKAHATAVEPGSAAPPPTPQPPPAPPTPRQPVELTAEEMAALMGRPFVPDKSAREGTG
jgi:hypothetical protein